VAGAGTAPARANRVAVAAGVEAGAVTGAAAAGTAPATTLKGERSREEAGDATSAGSTGESAAMQGLTLVHFSAQLAPCLTHKNTLHAPKHPLYMGYTTHTRTPIP
jgi:hypothetical protein